MSEESFWEKIGSKLTDAITNSRLAKRLEAVAINAAADAVEEVATTLREVANDWTDDTEETEETEEEDETGDDDE